ncbi:Abhydrolase domain containing protein 12 [Tolypocladium paradoxum]|uniref:Abhydrolase domain containing protein 12 n=1 Tax=Tolypocladium paradoxum TaxID=94208 RepID=A0A2S4KKZ6_9HYPO|nr:Abhydrolase domain containing protein 12 [Tolypocladium paradoxum]
METGLASLLQLAVCAAATIGALYGLLLLLLGVSFIQRQVVYLNRMAWNDPRMPTILNNGGDPFPPHLTTKDGHTLHAGHVLPAKPYCRHASRLAQEPAGLAPAITTRLSVELLRDDLDSLLVLYFHGAGGSIASGWRPASYRAMSALEPERIHQLPSIIERLARAAARHRRTNSSSTPMGDEGGAGAAIAHRPLRPVPRDRSCNGTGSPLRHERGAAATFFGIVLVAPFADVEQLNDGVGCLGRMLNASRQLYMLQT